MPITRRPVPASRTFYTEDKTLLEMNTASKLKLYTALLDKEKRPSPPQETPAPESLAFDSFTFQKAEVDSDAFLRRQILSDLHLGEKRLTEYLPLHLNAILNLAVLPEQEELIHPQEVLFLDTETTGLHRGTGNIVFLVGLAYFTKKGLAIEQLYLDSIDQEEDLWEYFAKLWQKFTYIVSYNGRSFDLPVIRNRLLLNRKKNLKPLLHFDLLHIFRRLFPQRSLPSYRQQYMEQNILGYFRKDDVPGADIPQIYFDYIKYKHDRGMAQVIKHNQLDLAGMALLFLEAVQLYEQRENAQGALRSGLARILLKYKNTEEALEMLKKEDESSVSLSSLRYRDLLLLAQLYRRKRMWKESAQSYKRIISEYNCIYAQMSLSKILEHHFKDYPAALSCALRLHETLKTLTLAKKRPKALLYSDSEIKQRLLRLQEKISKENSLNKKNIERKKTKKTKAPLKNMENT